jgi:flagellin
MSVINTNISALAAQSSLRQTNINSATSMERLSTGIRINSAKDDAAGLAISTRMTATIRGMATAIRNSNDGISLTQTAEGSLSAIQNNLQRIRELAVQSANSGNSQSDRDSMNLESKQLISEIDRVSTNAAFNGSKLLDGTFKDQDFQVGSGNDLSDRIRISIGSAKASALGTIGVSTSTSSTAASGFVTTTASLKAGDLAINGFAIGATSSDGVSIELSTASGISKANAINASTSLTGVTAKALATTASFSLTSGATADATTTGAVAAGSITINGVDIGALEAQTTTGNGERTSQIVAAINAKSAQTGVTAAVDGSNASKFNLTAADGRNITTKIASTSGLGGLSAATTTATANIVLSTTPGTSSTVAVTGTSAGKLAVFNSATPTLTFTADTSSAQTVSAVDLSSQGGAQSALSILDKAIDTITNSRANLGAYQNRFEAAISNLEVTSTNLQASRSRILDTDYAKETTNLAKAQIVQQAATAMLAQANQSSQSVLALLK